MHFLLDCPAYSHIRDCFADLFPIARSDDDVGTMRAMFGHHNQARLAKCVLIMTEFRKQCMLAVADGSIQGVIAAESVDVHVVRLQHLALCQNDILPQLSQLPEDLY